MSVRSISGAFTRDRNFILGLVALSVVFGGYVLAATGLLRAPLEKSKRTVTAVFDDTASLTPGAVVRVAGVKVGEVTDVRKTGDGRTTTVAMELTDGAPRLRRDATAALRWRLLLGGNYQIELNPGDGPRQAAPERIDTSHTSAQVEIDQVLSVLRSKQRAGIRSTLDELPQAFLDRRAPGRALQTLADVAPRLDRAARGIRGEHADRDLRRLVVSAARTVRAVDAPTDPIRDVVEGGARTLETVAQRDQDVDATVTRAAHVLPRIRQTLQRLDTTITVADPTLERLIGPIGAVEPTVLALRPTVVKANRLLLRAQPFLRQLRPAATALRGASRDGSPLLDGLEPSLRRLDARILPDLALKDRTSGRRTYEMIGPTVASFVAVAGNFDAVSHYAALDAVGGDPKVDTASCQTYLTDLKPGQIATCETLLQTMQQLLGATPPRKSR